MAVFFLLALLLVAPVACARFHPEGQLQRLISPAARLKRFNASLPPLPNVEFIGRGYDIVRANPRRG